MKFALFIAYKYIFSKNKKTIIAKITLIAIITTALSTMMPLMILSLMNGYHDSIQKALTENEFHLVIIPVGRNMLLTNKEQKLWYENKINEIKEIVWSINDNNDEYDKIIETIKRENITKLLNRDFYEQHKDILPQNKNSFDYMGKLTTELMQYRNYNEILPEEIEAHKLPELLALKGSEMITAVVPYVDGKGLIKTPLRWQPVIIRGFTKDINDVKSFKNNIKIDHGSFDFETEYQIMMGKELASNLNINIDKIINGKGQLVDIITDIGMKGNIDPNIVPHQVSAIFTSGYSDIDSQVVFMNIYRAKNVLKSEQYSGIGVKLKDSAYVPIIRNRLSRLLGQNQLLGYLVKPGTLSYSSMFRAHEWEKNLMFFVVGIMILASFLTIFITLNILVINKKEEIGILRSIGVNAIRIKLVFIAQGFLIGFVGSAIGSILGIFITTNINNIVFIAEKFMADFLYLYVNPINNLLGLPEILKVNIIESSSVVTSGIINYVIYITDIVIVITGSIFMSLLAAYFPSSKAAKANIVEVLRYE